MGTQLIDPVIDLLACARGRKFGTILADPPWQFQNRTGKVAPDTSGSTATAPRELNAATLAISACLPI